MFTGYSALAVALALPPDGRILACDISDEFTRVGRPYWERAGVAGKIDLVLEPALHTLDARLAMGEAGRYDFAFIDADKATYDGYYERCLKLLRVGGLIAIDNVLWSGRVAQNRRRVGRPGYRGTAVAQRQAPARRTRRSGAGSDRRRTDARAQALRVG